VAGLFVLADSKKVLCHLVDGEFQRAAFEVYLNFGDFHQIIADSRRWLSFQGVVAEESFLMFLNSGTSAQACSIKDFLLMINLFKISKQKNSLFSNKH
jgi:hypothetical protein